MDIKVERGKSGEDQIVFTITVTGHDCVDITPEEFAWMHRLDALMEDMALMADEQGKVYELMKLENHKSKDKLFNIILDKLKMKIEINLRQKFRPMVQEIYNWIFDHQDGTLREWMIKYNPDRTRYYFDNDIETENLNKKGNVDEDVEVDDEDDDDS